MHVVIAVDSRYEGDEPATAEEVNELAMPQVPAGDIATTRRTLLAIVENLAADEMASLASRRRMPSTRELSRLLDEAGPLVPKSARRRPVRSSR